MNYCDDFPTMRSPCLSKFRFRLNAEEPCEVDSRDCVGSKKSEPVDNKPVCEYCLGKKVFPYVKNRGPNWTGYGWHRCPHCRPQEE